MSRLYLLLHGLAITAAVGLVGYQLVSGPEARGTTYILLECLAVWLLILFYGALEVTDDP